MTKPIKQPAKQPTNTATSISKKEEVKKPGAEAENRKDRQAHLGSHNQTGERQQKQRSSGNR